MRKLKIPAFSMFAIVLLSVLAAAAMIAFPIWSNGLNTITIAKGASATFSVGVGSPQPPISYNVYLYNDAGSLINTVKSATLPSSTYDTVTVTPADYNNMGGTYHVFITASDVDDSDWNQELTLIVTDLAPVLSHIPDVTVVKDSSATLDLNNYVTDADDALNTLTWTVTGNTLAAVDVTAGVATFTAGSSTGSDVLNITVCDTSNVCASQNVLLTVTDTTPSPIPTSTPQRELNVKDIGLQAFGDSMLLIRNHGLQYKNVKLDVAFDSVDTPMNSFTFNIDPNTVKYLVLDTEGVKSGDYLIKVHVSTDDSTSTQYMILSV